MTSEHPQGEKHENHSDIGKEGDKQAQEEPIPSMPGAITTQPLAPPDVQQTMPSVTQGQLALQPQYFVPQGNQLCVPGMQGMRGVPPVTEQPMGMPGIDPGAAGMTLQQMHAWMAMPAPMVGVPPGLEYLTLVDTIVVHQIYELLEILSGWECKNKYSIRNANGEQVYYAAEESDCCERQCCGPQRGFDMHIVDNFKREVIRIVRPFSFCAGCCWWASCCPQVCTIESPPGFVIGTVQQTASGCSFDFVVRNEKEEDIFIINGPCCCMLSTCADKEFQIYTLNGKNVGVINKLWGGIVRELFTDADVFKVTFPVDLDVKMKAVLMGATFLIDFMAFEQPKNQ